MSIGKRIGIAAGLVVLIVILAIAALAILVKPEQIKEMALERAREDSGFDIEAGPATLHLGLSGVGVRVDSLRLASPDSLQVVGVENVDVYAKLLPLLRKRIELKHLVVHRPMLRMRDPGRKERPEPTSGQEPRESAPLALLAVESWSVEDGTYRHAGRWGELELTGLDLEGDLSWDPERGGSVAATGSVKAGLFKGEAGAFDLPSGEVSAAIRFPARGDSILLPRIEVTSGKLKALLSGAFGLTDDGWEGVIDGRAEPVSWDDLRELIPPDSLKKIEDLEIGGDFELKEIRIESRVTSDKSLVSGLVDFSDVSVKSPQAPLGLSAGEGHIRFRPGLIEVETGKGRIGDHDVQFQARVEGEEEKRLNASLTASVEASELSRVLPEDSEMELEGGKIDVDLSVSGRLPFAAGAIPSVTGTVGLSDLAGRVQDLPLADAAGMIRFRGRSAEVEGLRATLGESDFSLDGSISDLSNPALDFVLNSNRLDLDALLPKERGREDGGPAGEKEPQVIGIPASGRIAVRALRYQKMEMENARATLRVTPEGIFLEDVSAEIQEGVIEGDLNLTPENGGRAWQYAGRMNLDSVPVSSTLNAWSNLGEYITGETDGDIDLSGRTAKDSDPLRDLTLGAAFKVHDGAFVNVPGLKAIGRALNIKEAVEESWAFRNLSGAVAVRQGRVMLDTLDVFQEDLEWSLAGSVGLDGTLDLRGTLFADPGKVTLPSEAKLLAPYITNDRGQIPIGFRMGGTFKSPDVGLDWESLLLRAAERAKREEPEKLRDMIRETLKDPDAMNKLKKILGGGK